MKTDLRMPNANWSNWPGNWWKIPEDTYIEACLREWKGGQGAEDCIRLNPQRKYVWAKVSLCNVCVCAILSGKQMPNLYRILTDVQTAR